MASNEPTQETPPQAAAHLPGGWILCDADCAAPERQGGLIWCRPSPGCNRPCQCRLFEFDTNADNPEWKMVAGPNVRITENPALSYRCWCVRPPAPALGPARAVEVWLADIVDADYADAAPAVLAEAPVDALQGLSAADADALATAFGIRTVRDLAQLKFVRWAQAIVALADGPVSTARRCEDIPDLDLNLQKLRLERTFPDEDWILPVARFMEGVRSRHCKNGTCATGTCIGRERNGSVTLDSQAADHVVVSIVATISCTCT